MCSSVSSSACVRDGEPLTLTISSNPSHTRQMNEDSIASIFSGDKYSYGGLTAAHVANGCAEAYRNVAKTYGAGAPLAHDAFRHTTSCELGCFLRDAVLRHSIWGPDNKRPQGPQGGPLVYPRVQVREVKATILGAYEREGSSHRQDRLYGWLSEDEGAHFLRQGFTGIEVEMLGRYTGPKRLVVQSRIESLESVESVESVEEGGGRDGGECGARGAAAGTGVLGEKADEHGEVGEAGRESRRWGAGWRARWETAGTCDGQDELRKEGGGAFHWRTHYLQFECDLVMGSDRVMKTEFILSNINDAIVAP